MSANSEKQYADRDVAALDKAGNYYSRHTFAMTEEGLHSKADIAGELAHRDCEIDTLLERVGCLQREVEILRQYGNKDCTAMADDALAKENDDG